MYSDMRASGTAVHLSQSGGRSHRSANKPSLCDIRAETWRDFAKPLAVGYDHRSPMSHLEPYSTQPVNKQTMGEKGLSRPHPKSNHKPARSRRSLQTKTPRCQRTAELPTASTQLQPQPSQAQAKLATAFSKDFYGNTPCPGG